MTQSMNPVQQALQDLSACDPRLPGHHSSLLSQLIGSQQRGQDTTALLETVEQRRNQLAPLVAELVARATPMVLDTGCGPERRVVLVPTRLRPDAALSWQVIACHGLFLVDTAHKLLTSNQIAAFCILHELRPMR